MAGASPHPWVILLLPALPLDLQPSGVKQREADDHAAVLDDLGHLRILREAIRLRTDEIDIDAARILERIGLQENAQHNERNRQDRQSHRYIPSGPRMMAAIPVRATSTRPSGSISVMNCSILSLAPAISNTKPSVVASITPARKASASRKASTRLSPFPFTLTIASSRSIASPASVISTTWCTGTSRSSWFLICSITIGVPVVTIVISERCCRCSVSDTVKDSILYPRPENSPMTRASTPGSLSTNTESVCVSGFCAVGAAG